MQIVIDIPKKAYETIKAEKEIDWLGVENILDCIKSGTPTEDVVSIKEIINEIDELYYDFENSDGNLSTFIIDGETLHTDVGYAIVGIEFYKNILKKRIGKNKFDEGENDYDYTRTF